MSFHFRDDVDRMSPSQLRAYVDDLERAVQLHEEHTGDQAVANLAKYFGLSGKEADLLALLSDGRIHSKVNILESLYFTNADDAPEIKIIDVYVCKIRKKLVGSNILVNTAWGNGYYVADAEPLLAVMRGERPEPGTGFDPVNKGKPIGALAQPYGTHARLAMAYIEANVGADGKLVATSKQISAAAENKCPGAVLIRNLERGGRIRVLSAPARGGQPGEWMLQVVR